MNTIMSLMVAVVMTATSSMGETVSLSGETPSAFLGEVGGQPHEAIQAAREAFALLESDPAAAAKKAKRALELLDESASPALRAELELLLALAEFKAKPGSTRADDLVKTLTKRYEKGIGESALTARSWLTLANYAFEEEDWADLALYGAHADKAIAAIEPGNYKVRAVAIVYEGIGKLRFTLKTMARKSTGSRITMADKKRFSAAVEAFERGIRLFPPQPNLKDFNYNLASLIAWRSTALAVFRTWDSNAAEAFASSPDRIRMPWPRRQVPGGCPINWKEQSEPDVPSNARRNGYAGAAVIVYDLNRAGEVANARVLAEVPTELFGRPVLEAMEKWRAAIPETMPDHCLLEHVLTYEFYFR
jgi:TonB family protein